MDYMNCDKCGSEFIVSNAMSASLRCPDCNRWVELEPAQNYSSRYHSKGYVDQYVDFDMDNYGYAE
jgi:uncharacterized Zn ribbon protein